MANIRVPARGLWQSTLHKRSKMVAKGLRDIVIFYIWNLIFFIKNIIIIVESNIFWSQPLRQYLSDFVLDSSLHEFDGYIYSKPKSQTQGQLLRDVHVRCYFYLQFVLSISYVKKHNFWCQPLRRHLTDCWYAFVLVWRLFLKVRKIFLEKVRKIFLEKKCYHLMSPMDNIDNYRI
jgi:hypothetical protein